ncbi:hypothetical protein FRAHR75_510016 [Frankia sp. Hr75.2]|nr:hypothetical protein FRAHR75_510016 [Frankia sp. Hr75.2]
MTTDTEYRVTEELGNGTLHVFALPTDTETLLSLVTEIFTDHWRQIGFGVIVQGAPLIDDGHRYGLPVVNVQRHRDEPRAETQVGDQGSRTESPIHVVDWDYPGSDGSHARSSFSCSLTGIRIIRSAPGFFDRQ